MEDLCKEGYLCRDGLFDPNRHEMGQVDPFDKILIDCGLASRDLFQYYHPGQYYVERKSGTLGVFLGFWVKY